MAFTHQLMLALIMEVKEMNRFESEMERICNQVCKVRVRKREWTGAWGWVLLP
jgi:hypothetical protein